MGFCVWLSVAIALTHVLRVESGTISAVSTRLETQYVTGSTPSAIYITATFPVTTSADDPVFTFDTALFTNGGTVACTDNNGGATATFNGCSVTATALTVDCCASGSIPAGSITFKVTGAGITALPASALVKMNTIAITISATTDNLAGGAEDQFWIIPAPTLQLTPSSTVSGTTPTTLDITTMLPFALANGDDIKVTANKAVFVTQGTGGSGLTETTGTTVMGTLTFSTSTTVLTVSGSNTVVLGTSITLRMGTPLLASLPASAGQVLLDITLEVSTVDYTTVDDGVGFGTITLYTGSDPITFYNDTKIKYWIPPRILSTLLATPDLKVLVGPLQGPTVDMQWFDRIVVTQLDGTEVVDIGVKPQLMYGNRSSYQRGHFNQLDVRIFGKKEPERLLEEKLMSSTNGVVRLGFHTRRQERPRNHQGLLTEYVHVESASISFIVVLSHAGTEYPHDHQMQVKYSHLDWIALDMEGESSFTGILPELWGAIPLSDEVAAMMIAPSKAATMTQTGACNAKGCLHEGPTRG